jgi:hypothetical protein
MRQRMLPIVHIPQPVLPHNGIGLTLSATNHRNHHNRDPRDPSSHIIPSNVKYTGHLAVFEGHASNHRFDYRLPAIRGDLAREKATGVLLDTPVLALFSLSPTTLTKSPPDRLNLGAHAFIPK